MNKLPSFSKVLFFASLAIIVCMAPALARNGWPLTAIALVALSVFAAWEQGAAEDWVEQRQLDQLAARLLLAKKSHGGHNDR